MCSIASHITTNIPFACYQLYAFGRSYELASSYLPFTCNPLITVFIILWLYHGLVTHALLSPGRCQRLDLFIKVISVLCYYLTDASME